MSPKPEKEFFESVSMENGEIVDAKGREGERTDGFDAGTRGDEETACWPFDSLAAEMRGAIGLT